LTTSDSNPTNGGAKLTPKQQRFIEEYLIDLNATQAAIRAGYSADSANKHARRLVVHGGISAEIARRQAEIAQKCALSAERVLEEIRRVALYDPRAYFDDRGNVKPFSQLTEEQAAAIASFDSVIANAKAGDHITDTVWKIRLCDKVRALELAAKHLGLVRDKVDVTVDLGESISRALAEGRRRAAQRISDSQH
jgi:phage terminase small subunit